MINKYNLLNVTSALKILSLLLVLMLAPLSDNNYIQGAIHSQMTGTEADPSKVSGIIINPGLDPMITLSSNSVTLSAAANSTGEVNVTSNITWTAIINPLDDWLTVNPVSATGNGTLTFTAQANTNKVDLRTASVLIHATGVADQTILVTQTQEKPAFTFSSSVTTGSLSINLQFLSGGTFYIDWGKGVQVAQTATTLGQTYSTTSYVKGDLVKVYGSGIIVLKASSGNLTSIDVAESPNLQKLYLDHNSLTTLNLSGNTNLTTLECSYNNLSSLDISLNAQLNDLSLGYNSISVLDLSKNSNLTILSCIANKLTSLDVTKNLSLTKLHCYLNKLTSLDVSMNPDLKILYCYSNNFTFTSLPQVKSTYTSYSYAPQAKIPANVLSTSVDLSSQLSANDLNGVPNATVYKWYSKSSLVPLISGTDYSELNGVFTFLKNPSDSVYCTMSNAAFPLFTGGDILRSVNLKVQLIIPVVTTIDVPVLKVGSTSATVNCSIINLGIPDPTSYGVCWTTNSLIAPTILNNKSDLGGANATGPFSVDLSGLAPGTTYYVRAFATNQAGTGYGVVIPFTTIGRIPDVTTEPVTAIGIHTATGNGTITDLGAPFPTDYGVVWSTSSNPTVELSNKSAQGPASSLGAFTSNIIGLIPNTTYYVRAYATNSIGTKYGNEVSFKTSSIQLTIADPTINPLSKVYDGKTSASFIPGTLAGVESGDDVSLDLITTIATYDNANAGSNKTITVTYVLTGTASFKYLPPLPYTISTGEITKAPLTVTAVPDTKTYDGNTTSIGIPTVLTLVTGDVALTPAIQVFDNADYGLTHVLTASGLTIKNGSGVEVTNNYTINYVPSPASGVINKLVVTVTAVTDSKIYDATVSSLGKPIIGLLATGDIVNVAPIQKFDNINVGNFHVLIPSGLTIKKVITGEDVTTNYNIVYVNSLNDGVILGKPTTAASPVITISKVYDGTTSAVVIPGALSGVDAVDIPNVTLNATASYDNATIGTGKIITVKYSLIGSVADTYAPPSDYVINTGEITGKALTASSPNFTSEKVYDGTTTLNVTPGVLFGVEAVDADKVILNATAVFDNANVGTGKTITVTYTLSGSAAINYTVPASFTVTDGVITGKPLTVVSLKLTTVKVYDGSNSAIFSVGSLSGVETMDTENVILSGIASYDNANAGTNKIILVAFNITGTAANNYIVPSDYTITNGEITAKPLTITNPVVITDKMYDGNTTAVVTTTGSLEGVEPIDINRLSVTAVANYNSMTVGSNKTITVVYILSGAAKDNYSAPVDFIITGAKISDIVTLSPTITSTSGCEGSYLDLEYTILTGTPTQYKIIFSSSALAAGIQNIDYTDLPSLATTGLLPVNIPKGTKDGVYQGTLQMRNELGIETILYSFQFTINVSSDFIIPKFDDVVLCDNSSNKFIAYQWYKNGIIIDGATKQFYNDLDGLIGSYSLKLTTTDGQTLYTCAKDLNIPLKLKLSVYPSPLKVNQPCTVKMTGMTNTELVGAELSVYTMQGNLIYHSVKVERLNSVYLPSVDGMYLGNITTSKGQVFPFKIIVEK